MTTDPSSDVVERWRCFHCGEVFSDHKLAEDHFGQTSLHPAACVDALRDDERAMRERAMFYERSWREELAKRHDRDATIERLSAERMRLREALTNAHARFGDIQHLNTHGMSNESYINSLRAIARDAQWELKIVLTAQASDAALSNTAENG